MKTIQTNNDIYTLITLNRDDDNAYAYDGLEANPIGTAPPPIDGLYPALPGAAPPPIPWYPAFPGDAPPPIPLYPGCVKPGFAPPPIPNERG
ncbi:unnamed protein product [Caenorhabditis bovis]|uniref:Uncharacterized protein n=1 Tax=Caenorhabditis bovis TaxID=2654633 RepID=A0A8S1ELY7_9PELO|nr:unnamed protein product [Caenorhabditis bovis]